MHKINEQDLEIMNIVIKMMTDADKEIIEKIVNINKINAFISNEFEIADVYMNNHIPYIKTKSEIDKLNKSIIDFTNCFIKILEYVKENPIYNPTIKSYIIDLMNLYQLKVKYYKDSYVKLINYIFI